MNKKTIAIFLLTVVSFLVSTLTLCITGASLPDFVQGMMLGISLAGFMCVLVYFGLNRKKKARRHQ